MTVTVTGVLARTGEVLTQSAIALAIACFLGCTTSQSSTHALPQKHGSVSMKDLVLDPAAQAAAQARAHWATGYHAAQYENNAQQALDEFAEAAALDPGNLALQIRVAATFEQVGQWDKALTIWERAVRSQPHSFELWQHLANAYRHTGAFDKAIDATQNARRANPTQSWSYAMLADLYWQSKKYAETLRILDEGTKINPKSIELWLALAQTAGRTIPEGTKKMLAPATARAAIEQAGKLTAQNPGYAPAVALVEGNFYVKTGEFTKAANQWLKIHPFSIETEQQIMGVMRNLPAGDRKSVAAAIEEAIKKQPLQPGLYNLLGALYEMIEDPGRATEAYRQSLILNATQFEVYRSLALVYARQKNSAEAQATIMRAKEKLPNDPRVPWAEGMVQTELKNYTKALQAYAEAEKLDATVGTLNRGAFHFQYGAAYERAGQRKSAEAQFRRAIAIGTDPHYETALPLLAQSYNYLGYMWADANEHLDEALDLIRKALALEPDNAAFLDSLGWVYFRLGRTDEALKQLKRAAKKMTEEATQENRKLTPDDAVVFDHVAQTSYKLGHVSEAIRYWERALELDPNNKELAEHLRQAQSSPSPSTTRRPLPAKKVPGTP